MTKRLDKQSNENGFSSACLVVPHGQITSQRRTPVAADVNRPVRPGYAPDVVLAVVARTATGPGGGVGGHPRTKSRVCLCS